MSLRNQSFRKLLLYISVILPVSLLLFYFASPIIGYLSGVAGILLCTIISQASLYKNIRHITSQVDLLISGGDFVKAPALKEGDLMALYARLILLNNRLQSAASDKQKDKQIMRRFLEDVAHQLKTPLSSLRLKLEAQETANNEPFIAACMVPIDRMTFLIQALLTIARLEAGALHMAFAEKNVYQTINSAADALMETLLKRRSK